MSQNPKVSHGLKESLRSKLSLLSPQCHFNFIWSILIEQFCRPQLIECVLLLWKTFEYKKTCETFKKIFFYQKCVLQKVSFSERFLLRLSFKYVSKCTSLVSARKHQVFRQMFSVSFLAASAMKKQYFPQINILTKSKSNDYKSYFPPLSN